MPKWFRDMPDDLPKVEYRGRNEESFPLWRDMTPEDARIYIDKVVKQLDPHFHKIVTEAVEKAAAKHKP